MNQVISGTISILLYTLLFLIISTFIPLPVTVVFIVVLISVVIFHQKINNFILRSLTLLYKKGPDRIEQILSQFDNRLNEISSYHELLPELYKLFNQLLAEKTWTFYVFENDGYRRIEYDTSISEENIPIELDIQIEKSLKPYFSLDELKKVSGSHRNIVIDIFQKSQLDFLIPINGKNRVTALLFISRRDLEILTDQGYEHMTTAVLNKAGQILENTALYLDLIQKNLEIKKLFEVSNKLLTSLHTEEILDFLLDALAEVIPFDAGVIFLFDPETNKLFRKVSKGYKDNIDLTLKLGQGAGGWVAKTKKISLLKDVEKAEHYYPARPETRSQISMPLEHQNELMGVLSLESNKIGHFNAHSIELLKLFANQAVIALYNAKQYEISLTKKHLEHELIHAGKVQKVLLPQRPPVFKSLDIAFAHIPSKMVSGDLFDLAPIDEKTLGLVIGDVSGKGAAAAIMMSLVLAGFRAYKKSHLAVCEIVARLNNLLEESISEGRFVTMFYSLISTDKNIITFTNAGHNPPLIFRADGTVEELSVGGIVLGFLANQTYIQKSTSFNCGDLLVCYTDGITEALSQEEEEFGEERLLQVVKENLNMNSYQLKNKILDEVQHFTKNDSFSDDLTTVIVKYP